MFVLQHWHKATVCSVFFRNLKYQLRILYSRDDFSNADRVLSSLQLFSKTVKLLKIISIITMTTLRSVKDVFRYYFETFKNIPENHHV